MTHLAALKRRPSTGGCGHDKARQEAHLMAVRGLFDLRRAAREGALGKLRDTPERFDFPATRVPHRSEDPVGFALRVWASQEATGADRMGPDDREHQRAAWASVAHRGAEAVKRATKAPEGGFRRLVWALRDLGRFTHPSHRCASCGWSAVGAPGISLREDGRLALSSVSTCGSVWGCPVCACTIKGTRAEGIKEGVELHRLHFGPQALALGSFTVRHRAGDSLRKMAEGFQAAWNMFLTRVPTEDKATRSLARRKGQPQPPALLEAFGFLGYVNGAEVTYGQNGWHYHRHPLFFFDRNLTHEDRQNFESRCARWWRECVETHMGADCAPTLKRGVRISKVTREDYISKLGLEVSEVGTKKGRDGNLSPWGLQQSAASGHGFHWDAWREYVHATRGLKAVQMSDRLRRLWKKMGWQSEVDDDEAAADESRGAVLVEELTAEQWRTLRASARVCDMLELGPLAFRSALPLKDKCRGKWGDGARVKADHEAKTARAFAFLGGYRPPTKAERRAEKAWNDVQWRATIDAPLLTSLQNRRILTTDREAQTRALLSEQEGGGSSAPSPGIRKRAAANGPTMGEKEWQQMHLEERSNASALVF